MAGMVVLVVAAALVLLPRWLAQEPPSMAIGGPFSLVDHTGRTVTNADFHGKMMLIYFGYTYCPDVCPTTLGTMSQAYGQLTPSEQSRIVPIFVTVDPERDTVAQMAEYVGNFSPALVGLTGSPEQLGPVLKAYRVYARKAGGDSANYSVDHSSILYLMDRDGKFDTNFPADLSVGDLLAGLKKRLAG